jgi:hypothetical protein
MDTLLQIVLPAVLIFSTLFGVLSQGDPKPGGVALFWRVGLCGLGLAALLWYLTWKTSVLAATPAMVRNLYRGLGLGGLGLTLFGALGSSLKRKR